MTTENHVLRVSHPMELSALLNALESAPVSSGIRSTDLIGRTRVAFEAACERDRERQLEGGRAAND